MGQNWRKEILSSKNGGLYEKFERVRDKELTVKLFSDAVERDFENDECCCWKKQR